MKKSLAENSYNSLLWGCLFFILFIALDSFLPLIGFAAGTFGYSLGRIAYSLIVMYAFFKICKTDKIFYSRLNINLLNKILIAILIGISLAIYFVLNNGYDEIILIFSKGFKTSISTLFVALAAGIFEEFLTRGFFFRYFLKNKKQNSLILASVYSSVLFGVLHLYNIFFKGINPTLQQVFYATAIGLLFAALRIAFNGLLVTVILHSLIDFQLNLVKPHVNQADNSWASVLVIFIPVAIISLVTIFSLEKEKNSDNTELI